MLKEFISSVSIFNDLDDKTISAIEKPFSKVVVPEVVLAIYSPIYLE